MKLNLRLGLVLVLSLIGASLAFSLLLQHHGEELGTAVVAKLCGEEADSGCNDVNRSAYAEVAGIPWAGVGLTFYFSMIALMALALATSDEAKAAAAGGAAALFATGLLIDVGLFAIQAFRIHRFCKLCLATYVLNAVALALLWTARRALLGARSVATQPAGRVIVVGWIVAALIAGVAVAAMETALKAREAYRDATILGVPTRPSPTTDEAVPATPEPTTPAPSSGSSSDVNEQLKAAQNEARQLKEALDDPQKYAQYQVNRSLKEFAHTSTSAIDLKNTPGTPPADAPIKIAVYSDFLCPFCRQIAAGFHGYLPHTASRVSLYYKFYPLDTCNPAFAAQPMHPGACWLAFGGVCAQEQNHFWPYHDKVFSMEVPKTAPDRAFVLKLATELGMNPSAFDTCLASPRTRDRVTADIAEGSRVGVKGTPTLFINKRKLPDLNATLQAIDEESKRLGLGPMPPVPGENRGH
jgi:protein-disulfide isomerase/uncharacterized membrane protein